MTSIISVDDANAFLAKFFDQAPGLKITELEQGRAVMQMPLTKLHKRPGGMANGPALMALADIASYIATFTMTDFNLMAVTTNLNMNFLRPLFGEIMEAEARVLRIGSTLSTSTVEIYAPDAPPGKIAGHAVVSFALPPQQDKTDASDGL